MLESGHWPRSLTPETRAEIQEQFTAKVILLARLVSFDQTPATPRDAFDDDDPITEPPYQLETRIPIHLSLLLVDSESGNVLTGSGAYLEPENPVGLFGILRDVRAATRLSKGIAPLVEKVLPRKGEDS